MSPKTLRYENTSMKSYKNYLKTTTIRCIWVYLAVWAESQSWSHIYDWHQMFLLHAQWTSQHFDKKLLISGILHIFFLQVVVRLALTICMRKRPPYWPSFLNHVDQAIHTIDINFIFCTRSEPFNVLQNGTLISGFSTFFLLAPFAVWLFCLHACETTFLTVCTESQWWSHTYCWRQPQV